MDIYKNSYDIKSFGQFSFSIGAFFLATALPISGVFFLFSIIASFIDKNSNLKFDQWDYPLFLSIGLIIFSTLNVTLLNVPDEISDINKTTIWLSLFNWIPLFFAYWGFQKYLENASQRKIFIQFLLAGSIPLLVSCILQYWFKVYGPFETLYGLIVWFQKPLLDNDGVSGLFSNQNYTGFWLSIIWPFAIFLLREKYNKKVSYIFLFLISLLIFYLSILTNSRNTILGIGLSLPLIFSLKTFIYIKLCLILIVVAYLLLLNKFLFNTSKIASFFPVALVEKLLNFEARNLLNFPRFEIWSKALELILEKPFLGWGASTFGILYINRAGIYKIQHTHNIPIELSYNFGIPLSIILSSFTLFLLYKGWRMIFRYHRKNINSLNIYWLTSVTVIYFSHINDIAYYDGKISILIWILLSGIKCIINEQRKNPIQEE